MLLVSLSLPDKLHAMYFVVAKHHLRILACLRSFTHNATYSMEKSYNSYISLSLRPVLSVVYVSDRNCILI